MLPKTAEHNEDGDISCWDCVFQVLRTSFDGHREILRRKHNSFRESRKHMEAMPAVKRLKKKNHCNKVKFRKEKRLKD